MTHAEVVAMSTELLGACVAGFFVAVGWYANGSAQRKAQILQEQLKYRLRMFHSTFPVFRVIDKHGEPFLQSGFADALADARMRFQLYGTADETASMEAFISAVEAGNLANANSTLATLKGLVLENYRQEIMMNRKKAETWRFI